MSPLKEKEVDNAQCKGIEAAIWTVFKEQGLPPTGCVHCQIPGGPGEEKEKRKRPASGNELSFQLFRSSYIPTEG